MSEKDKSREEQNKLEAEIIRKRILEIINNTTDPEVLYKIYLMILKAASDEAPEEEED